MVTIPFPEEALESKWPIDLLLSAWSKIPPVSGITRSDVTGAMFLYTLIIPIRSMFDRKTLYRLITCPFDVRKAKLVNYWKECCRCLAYGRALPEPTAGEDTLEECEVRYRQMDIFHHMSSIIHAEEDRNEEKHVLCERINRLIIEDITKYERRCVICEAVIPAIQKSKFCKVCRAGRKTRYEQAFADEICLVAAV